MYYKITNRMTNLYFDIKTKAKLKKVTKKTGKSASKIIRLWVASPKFDAMVEELNNQLGE
jgi:hypothetical protein